MTVRLANEATVSNAMVTATGILVDETGQPLIGASVVVKGGKERTITDRKGAFSLEVPANAICDAAIKEGSLKRSWLLI